MEIGSSPGRGTPVKMLQVTCREVARKLFRHRWAVSTYHQKT